MEKFDEAVRAPRNLKYAEWFLVFSFYVLLTNVPFWAATRLIPVLPIGWFCLEYALVGILALFIPRLASAALLLLLMAADLISAVSKTYYLSPTECLSNMHSVHELSSGRLVVFGSLGALMLLVLVGAYFLPVDRIRGTGRLFTAASLLGFVGMAVSVDYVAIAHETGRLPSVLSLARPADVNRFSSYRDLWMSRYPLVRLVRNERMFGVKRDVAVSTAMGRSPMSSATATALSSVKLTRVHQTQGMPNLVLILVESWGLHADAAVQDSLVEPYSRADLTERYKVVRGTVPFNGGTVAGEARELCGSQMGLDIMNAPESELQGCLPAKLASAGYHTISVHGMTRRMFSRSAWYPSIGFQERWFRSSLEQQGLPDCIGAFNGTCDASIAEWIGKRLATPTAQPQFVYWVTLNSHLPVPIPSGLAAPAACSVAPALNRDPALCSWYQLVENVHRTIAAVATNNLARDTVFVVVGDHAPPFASPGLRTQFSSTDVPYLVLLPRQRTPSEVHDRKQNLPRNLASGSRPHKRAAAHPG